MQKKNVQQKIKHYVFFKEKLALHPAESPQTCSSLISQREDLLQDYKKRKVPFF